MSGNLIFLQIMRKLLNLILNNIQRAEINEWSLRGGNRQNWAEGTSPTCWRAGASWAPGFRWSPSFNVLLKRRLRRFDRGKRASFSPFTVTVFIHTFFFLHNVVLKLQHYVSSPFHEPGWGSSFDWWRKWPGEEETAFEAPRRSRSVWWRWWLGVW